MATHWGTEGTVKFSANTIAEIVEFSVTETITPVDDTSMGDAAHTHISGSGISSWTAELTCHWDETDTDGQVASVAGARATLNLYPEGASGGDAVIGGAATVTERGVAVKMDGETIKQTFKFLGSGALTYTNT